MTQYSAVQCLDTQHAGGDVTVGNGACVGVALLLKMTQNFLIFGTPYVEHCVHTRRIVEWLTAYIFDSKIIHKNCNQKQLQTHKHATANIETCSIMKPETIQATERNNGACS